MDVTFSNVLEGTRQYFLGLPKQTAAGESTTAGAGWGAGDEAAPAQSGAPTPTAPPPSAAAAPPPRPPSEPLEPEPHIIHKATVMREAAEKRREQPEPDDDEMADAMSPPPHIIRRPPPEQVAPPASPRPPSKAPTPVTSAPPEPPPRGPTPHAAVPVSRPPEHFTPARPPDPYSSSRPPEPYPSRFYEPSVPVSAAPDTCRPLGPLPSPQPPPRHGSPQTYARLSSTLPAHAARLREAAAQSPPAQRYAGPPTQPPPPHNDRVPPIHHPSPVGVPSSTSQRIPVGDARNPQYQTLPQRREPSPYSRAPHFERHPTLPQRKYDPQQAYPGYRPTPTAPQPVPNHRIESHHVVQYKHAPVETLGASYPPRSLERVPAPQHAYQHETIRRAEYPVMNRTATDARNSYHYPTPSTSSARYAPVAPTAVPVVQTPAAPPRPVPRPVAAPKSNYEYPITNHIQTSAARTAVKPGYPNQQARMTVSVTSLVNQMNQTKQKRESPLDLSVKTVKNSADSSTTPDDMVDSASAESKILPLQVRPSSSGRHSAAAPGFGESHKVDFAPDFSQYRERERTSSQSYPATTPPNPVHQPPLRYNGTYETRRPATESFPVESRQHVYPDRSKYSVPVARTDYVPRIDLTRSAVDEHRPDTRIRDDRHFIIERERKRPAGPIVSNIPEKIVRYETWSADSRIDRMTQSAREQRELMSQPVYSYSSHKQYEAYHNEQKRLASTTAYRDHHHHHQQHINHRYAYPPDVTSRERHDYHPHHHHHDRNPSLPSRQVIQKIPSHRDIHPHHIDPHSGIPADKRVLSILRNSLETKQTGFVEPPRQAKHIPDLIVIDDEHDSVIEITDLTKDNEVEVLPKSAVRPPHCHGPIMGQHIQMPKAVDSIDNTDSKSPPENDVASRIRTKAELKVLPSDTSMRSELKPDEPVKVLPKSQKQHLFNQIREDQILESVIKCERNPESTTSLVKTEPMNIDEIEKDAVLPIKVENDVENVPLESIEPPRTPEPEDLDWANACDSFMEQLKTGVHKKKTHRKRLDTLDRDNENKTPKLQKAEPIDSTRTLDKTLEPVQLSEFPIVIKQEPIDDEETKERVESPSCIVQESKEEVKPQVSSEKSDSKKCEDTKTIENKIVSSAHESEKGETTEAAKKKSASNKKESPKTAFKPLELPDKIKESPKTVLKSLESPDKIKESPKTALKSLESSDKIKESPKKALKSLESPDKIKSKLKKSLTGEKAKVGRPRKSLTLQDEKDKIISKKASISKDNEESSRGQTKKLSSRKDTTDNEKDKAQINKTNKESPVIEKKITTREEKKRVLRKSSKLNDKINERAKEFNKEKESNNQNKVKKSEKNDTSSTSTVTIKKEIDDDAPLKTVIKEEPESTDDDEPLIKSKMQKEKDMKYQLLKDLSEKSAYVKLECFDVDMNKNTRISVDSITKDKEKPEDNKTKHTKQVLKSKDKIHENTKSDANKDDDSTSTSDDEDLTVATRLRVRKNTKTDDSKTNQTVSKTLAKSSPKKQDTSTSNSSTPLRKPGFGDGSDFHPGWEEELYRYKRSIRMPTRLIAIPRGRSGGPFVRRSGPNFNRGSTSLPDLDPAPLSPAPSSAPSAATDDLYARRQDKNANVDSDLESNSSYSATNKLQYDSEASTSTIFSTSVRKKGSSIVDVLIQKCGKQESKKKQKDKEKDEKTPKLIPKSTNTNELLPTPSLGLLKNGNKGSLSAKKEKLMEDIFYLGAFRKETVNAYRNAFIKNTDGLIGATEEFAPVVLKSRTRTESRVLKQRATIKEVFGDERPASAPPSTCREEDPQEQEEDEPIVQIKEEKDMEPKLKLKSKKILKEKLKRRSSSIRDGLRSTKSLKRNDAKGRLLRLKKRNSLMKSLANKRLKDLSSNKIKKEKPDDPNDNDKSKEESNSPGTVEGTKRRLKRLFGRRKFSSGFDYIRKKKKIIRRDDTPNNRIRRPAVKPSPESVHDIHKEIKGWFINKSIGETHLHRAARLGYTDCVAYCLEKMGADPTAKDNAGFTPLHVAAAKGHVRIARLLLQYGANVSAAANGGIRPLHEACENGHVEMIRLLLSYGADPLLGTYAGQTPEELTEGPAAVLLRLHIADVQGHAIEPWRFPPPADIIDREELGCDPLSSPPPGSPPPPPDATIEMQCTEFPLPPFYSLKTAPGQPADGLWCLLQDVTNLLQIKSKESLLKQIHCGSGSPKELLREIRTQEFLERAQCHQLLCAGEKVNIRASKVALVRVTDKLRQLLKIETVLIS